jgi:uncharacterized tellurite resistance protein B-like protein
MNLSEKGWFRDLVRLRAAPSPGQIDDKESYLYSTIQPSGLMYGHPIVPKEFNSTEFIELDQSSKMKLVLIEGFIKTAVMPSQGMIPKDAEEFVHFLSKSIVHYYEAILPEKEVKIRTFWGKKLSYEDIVESLLTDRLEIDPPEPQNFWHSFFNNSLLFLDVFFFGEWISSEKTGQSMNSIKHQRDQLHMLLLKVMAASAYSDQSLDEEEKILFNHFLASAQLPENMVQEASALIENGIDIEEIDTSVVKTWILRKYLLELAILTIWADKVVSEEEKSFITRLANRLGFDDDELMASMAAIESFVISNWGNIPFLKEKHNFSAVGDRFVDLIATVVDKNRDDIASEIQGNEEIVNLLNRSAKGELNEDEQIVLRNHLLSILRRLPVFVIISLPGSFLTLPLLLKILPETVLPNAFREA